MLWPQLPRWPPWWQRAFAAKQGRVRPKFSLRRLFVFRECLPVQQGKVCTTQIVNVVGHGNAGREVAEVEVELVVIALVAGVSS